MKMLLSIVGGRIRYLRKNRGFTQSQLGEKVDLPQSYIGAIERGQQNISLETLERIIRALAVDPTEVLTWAKDKDELKNDMMIDKVVLRLQDRNTIEIEIISKLVDDVLNAFDAHKKDNNIQ